jgi:hypothetical protein
LACIRLLELVERVILAELLELAWNMLEGYDYSLGVHESWYKDGPSGSEPFHAFSDGLGRERA